MEKNGTFLLKNGKERNVLNGKECDAQPWKYGSSEQEICGKFVKYPQKSL